MFADVIVPVPLDNIFTYRIPEDLIPFVKRGARVVVPFGTRKKSYTAIVVDIKHSFNDNYDLKDLVWAPDTEPIVRRPQLELWDWISNYYMCPPGDVLKAALPSGLKIESETFVTVNNDFDEEKLSNLTEKEILVWQTVKTEGKISVHTLEIQGIKNVMSVIYRLVEIGALQIYEKLSERFHTKKEELYHITINSPNLLSEIFAKMRSPRHQRLMMKLIQLSDFTKQGCLVRPIGKDEILNDESYDRAIIKSFEKKGLIKISHKEVSRFKWSGAPLKGLPVLTEAQEMALRHIHNSFKDHSVSLLHGVTSSGKTEIYIHLIDFILKQGKQVLYLVPEIALTTQLTKRLQDVFGDKVVIYHSRFTDAQRSEIWQKMLKSNEPMVVLGARSSVFLPFAQLGLIIVDEEHEQSYKQFDPAPRYNARDVAIVLSRLHGAKTLLASATPSVETYKKALDDKFGLISLNQRYDNAKLPDIRVIDMNIALQKGQIVQSLSQETIKAVRKALDNKEQMIFFHNRRGYAPVARCKQCAYIPKCTDCDVTLTYHKNINKLSCHYCGKEYAMPTVCPVCKQPSIEIIGYGTERVEDKIGSMFPEARIARMDLDTTRNKENYATIIEDFSHNKADILIGTQMVTKGLDFGGVTTVIIPNADMIINYPEFRATERAFNMLEQVSGRAGRRSGTDNSSVIIQTRQPDHPIINFLINHDYIGFYKYEVDLRKGFAYPPFTKLIYLYIRHRDEHLMKETSQILSDMLKKLLGNRVFGPQQPNITRIKNMYIGRIMIKVEDAVSVSQIKQLLKDSVTAIRSSKKHHNADFYFDVDPM